MLKLLLILQIIFLFLKFSNTFNVDLVWVLIPTYCIGLYFMVLGVIFLVIWRVISASDKKHDKDNTHTIDISAIISEMKKK